VRWFLIFLLCLGSTLLQADDHWGTTPPLPKLNIYHYPAMGVVEISFISDSTVDRPIWYILEVKQEGDPNANWFRPFNPLQGAVFNQQVSLELNYRDAAGRVSSWFKAEMVRIRVMWGA
tara:strand:+ start:897 stop:1253 length:357 start_codon:yes stop_codon:yes gene_type:complete